MAKKAKLANLQMQVLARIIVAFYCVRSLESYEGQVAIIRDLVRTFQRKRVSQSQPLPNCEAI